MTINLKYFSLFFAGLLSSAFYAQEFSVSGNVFDEKNEPISYTNVVLHNKSDDAFVSGTSTDDNGDFVLNAIAAGNYILKVREVYYEDKQHLL